MADVTDAWIDANPTINTPDKIAVFLWDTSENGTFVFDGSDEIQDLHAGGIDFFTLTSTFKYASIIKGVGYSKVQTYRCGNKIIGVTTIDRKTTFVDDSEFIDQIRKSDPVVK